jgi:hypothetical protein
MPAFRPPGDCPVCAEFVPARHRACPHCGATAKDGWSHGTGEDGLDLPDDSFDYEEFVAREFGGASPDRRRPNRRLWTITAVLVLLALVGGWFLWRT